MLSLAGSLKVFVAVGPCDLRKGFNGLHALVTERMQEDPKAGALFVFTNRRRTRPAVPGPMLLKQGGRPPGPSAKTSATVPPAYPAFARQHPEGDPARRLLGPCPQEVPRSP